jgi:hypothetical protein
MNDATHHYILRFESVLQLASNKKIAVWMDIPSNLDIQVPTKQGKIKIKVLRLPRGVPPKN